MITKVDHIDLGVRNVEDFISMFKKMGFEEVLRTSHQGGSVELKLPGSNQVIFEIHKIKLGENPCISHLAFLCDDIDKTCEDLTKKGIIFEEGPKGGTLPVYSPVSGRKSASFRNPDGRRIQLVDAKRMKVEEKTDI